MQNSTQHFFEIKESSKKGVSSLIYRRINDPNKSKCFLNSVQNPKKDSSEKNKHFPLVAKKQNLNRIQTNKSPERFSIKSQVSKTPDRKNLNNNLKEKTLKFNEHKSLNLSFEKFSSKSPLNNKNKTEKNKQKFIINPNDRSMSTNKNSKFLKPEKETFINKFDPKKLKIDQNQTCFVSSLKNHQIIQKSKPNPFLKIKMQDESFPQASFLKLKSLQSDSNQTNKTLNNLSTTRTEEDSSSFVRPLRDNDFYFGCQLLYKNIETAREIDWIKKYKTQTADPIQIILPEKMKKDASFLIPFFSEKFIKDVFLSPYRESGKDLSEVLLFIDDIENLDINKLPNFFLASNISDLICGLWIFCNLLFLESIAQILFQTWIIFDGLISSKKLFLGLDAKTFTNLSIQTILILLEKISDFKNVSLISCIVQSINKIIESGFLSVKEVVLLVGCSFVRNKPGIESEKTSIGKIFLLKNLMPFVVAISQKNIFPILFYILQTIKSQKHLVREECYSFLIEAAKIFERANIDFSSVFFEIGFNEDQFNHFKTRKNEFSEGNQSLHYHVISVANTKKIVLMSKIKKMKLENENKKMKLENENAFKNSRKNSTERKKKKEKEKPVESEEELQKKKLKKYSFDIHEKTSFALNSMKQELEEMIKLQPESITVCSYCKIEDVRFSNSAIYDQHLLKECLMLIECEECSTVVEILDYRDHLLLICEKRCCFYKCSDCNKVLHTDQMKEHQTMDKCILTDVKKNCVMCPLCDSFLTVIENSFEKTLKAHFLSSLCLGQKRTKLKDLNVNLSCFQTSIKE